ncbi:sodium/potassium-transporting ATPase subunit alpha [Drosophila tropicalis]|uniref:sodium/potassium-transporting ATPase subunit alpha n=1 Tax=Drosophila tropicalis TaxID=46794 RepID=UPI0035ABB0AF
MKTHKSKIRKPQAISKWLCSNVGFACSHVTKGYGLGLAIACGNESEVGLMARLSMEQRPQSRVRKHMNQITYCTAVVGILLFFIFICTISTQGLTYKHSFRFNLGLMIAMIPLFLPTVTYFGMVHIANRMLKSNCHIRNLESTSTLGLTTVICSDMTGTLTMNRTRVSEIFVDADLYRASDVNRNNIGARFLELIRVSVLCNDAVISPGTEGVPKLKKALYGSADDVAFLKFALPIIDDIDQLRSDHVLVANKCYNVFDQIHVTVHKTHNEEGAVKYILLMKGRYRAVLNYCSTYAINDEEILLDDDLLNSIDDVASQLTQAGRRVCAFAYKELDNEMECQRVSRHSETETYETTNTKAFKDYLQINIHAMRFIGLITAHDPPRAQLSTAVGDCRSAGIKLVLCTRQSASVAQDIARDVGIIGPDSETLEDVAQRLNIDKSQVKRSLVTAAVINMRDYVQEKMHHQRFHIQQLLLAHIDLVFAATTTAQRHLIVDVCQSLGAIVTVIGTGVYYTPAIRRANVGVAKADSTHTSISTADMVLLDSNFVSLVNAIDMSRCMCENLKKVITYCLSTNITIILVHLSFIIFKVPFRIYITIVFVIAFLVNMLPSLSLFYEKAEENLMRQKPKIYDDFIINRRIIMVAFVIVGSIEAGAVFLIYFIYMAENGFLPQTLMGLSLQWFDDANNDITDSYGQEWTSDARKHLQNEMSTISLMTIIVMQCTNLILCKTGRANILYHGFSNILLNLSVIYLLIFGFLLQFVDLRHLLHLVPITNVETFMFYVWPFVVVLAVSESIRRYLIRQFPGSWLELTTLY